MWDRVGTENAPTTEGDAMRIAWGKKVSANFVAVVIDICRKVGIEDPSWLMACIAFETGRTFSPSVRNAAGSGATGLIQFMPSTARGLGTTTDLLAMMSAEEQLSYVLEYFRPYAGKMRAFDDVYMAILWPKAIGKLLQDPLFKKHDEASRAYMQNKGLDVNEDGVVTKGEAVAKVQRLLDEGLKEGNVLDLEEPEEAAEPEQQEETQQADSSSSATDNSETQPSERPMIPAVLTALLPTVLGMFAPRVSAAFTKATGQPPETLQPLLADLYSAIGKATGVGPVNSDAQAVQAVVALQQAQPTVVKQVESDALDILDKYAPMLEKAEQYARQAFEDTEMSMDRAADRYIGAAYDPAPALTRFAMYGVATLLLAMCVWITTNYIKGQPIPTELWAALTGLIGWLTAQLQSIYANRFGTTRNSAAKDVVIQQLATKQQPARK